jgi:hypothetical protein
MPNNKNLQHFAEVYVKISYTSIYETLYIYKNVSIEAFINDLKEKINAIMELSENTYELVLWSPTTQVNLRPEEKDAFNPNKPNHTAHYYFPTNDSIVFYIRLLNTDTTLITTPETTPPTTEIIFDSLHECGICLSTENILSPHCIGGHLMCNTCYESCLRSSIHNCPFCRANLI